MIKDLQLSLYVGLYTQEQPAPDDKIVIEQNDFGGVCSSQDVGPNTSTVYFASSSRNSARACKQGKT